MNALVELLMVLQCVPRVPTANGPVVIFDADSTRRLDEAMAHLDAQMSCALANIDGSGRGLPSITAPLDPGDGIQRGNTDLEQPGDISQLWDRR